MFCSHHCTLRISQYNTRRRRRVSLIFRDDCSQQPDDNLPGIVRIVKGKAKRPGAPQQIEVKDSQFLMNDPYTASLSLEAMTPDPGKTPSAVMALDQDDASAGWEQYD